MSDEPPVANNSVQRLGGVTGKGFMPGQSGNPSGRPSVSKKIREFCQQFGEEAALGLLALARDPKEAGAVRRGAWTDLLDRGFGKPTIGEPDEGGQQAVTQVVYSWASDEGKGEE